MKALAKFLGTVAVASIALTGCGGDDGNGGEGGNGGGGNGMDMSKVTATGLLATANEKVKEKGEASLSRINMMGVKEDGSIDLNSGMPTSGIQFIFKVGDKYWQVQWMGNPVNKDEPMYSLMEATVGGDPAFPADAVGKFKDSTDLAAKAKTGGLDFSQGAMCSYYTLKEKPAAVWSDMAGKSVMLDAQTGDEIK